MGNPNTVKVNGLSHRDAESIGETLKHIESLLILCTDSVRLHAIPEMQNVGDVLDSLAEPIFDAKKKAKSLEEMLFADFTENVAGNVSPDKQLEAKQ